MPPPPGPPIRNVGPPPPPPPPPRSCPSTDVETIAVAAAATRIRQAGVSRKLNMDNLLGNAATTRRTARGYTHRAAFAGSLTVHFRNIASTITVIWILDGIVPFPCRTPRPRSRHNPVMPLGILSAMPEETAGLEHHLQ